MGKGEIKIGDVKMKSYFLGKYLLKVMEGKGE